MKLIHILAFLVKYAISPGPLKSEVQHTSSYVLNLSSKKEGTTLEGKLGLPLRDYATHGGSVPIRVKGVGVVGVVTVFGVTQRDDHAMVIRALAELCRVPLDGVALD